MNIRQNNINNNEIDTKLQETKNDVNLNDTIDNPLAMPMMSKVYFKKTSVNNGS